MNATPDPVAAQRRRLDRLILIWPLLGILVAGIGVWDDRRIGRPFSWAALAAGAAIILWGGVVYLACRWRLRIARRLIDAIRSS